MNTPDKDSSYLRSWRVRGWAVLGTKGEWLKASGSRLEVHPPNPNRHCVRRGSWGKKPEDSRTKERTMSEGSKGTQGRQDPEFLSQRKKRLQ